METEREVDYIVFPINNTTSGLINDEEEIENVEALDECILTDDLSEFTDNQLNVEILTEKSDNKDDDESFIYPIYIKEEVDDESLAVEALRQLGGMYSQVENKKIVINNQDEKWLCSYCGERFDKKIDLNNHTLCHHIDKPYACQICGNLFLLKNQLQTHMNQQHTVDRPHKCNICATTFQRPSSLSNHMKVHTYVAGRALMQLQNDNESLQADEIESELNVGQTQWSCTTSATTATTTYTFQNDQDQGITVITNGEYNLQTNPFSNSESVFQVAYIDKKKNLIHTCNQCGISFSQASALVNHEKIHKSKIWSTPIDCQYCDKQFQNANHLALHHKTCSKKLQNNSEKNGVSGKWGKHACSECGKKFTTKQKMFRHQWIHRKKTHSCEICDDQFEKQSELDSHRLSEHPQDSPFTCPSCGKCFVSRQGLWEHGRTHSANDMIHFQCDTCSKTFSSRQGYLIHHRTHTGERPYGCKYCWKAFRDGGTLRKHERIHTGERPHVCPLCSRAFNQKVVLREHVRWVHTAGKYDSESTGPPYLCPICEIETQDRDELCAHIVKHSDKMIADAKSKNNKPNIKTKSVKKKLIINSIQEDKQLDINTKPVESVNEINQSSSSSSADTQIEIQEIEMHIDEQSFKNDILYLDESSRSSFIQDYDGENEGICGICGDTFTDKNILMEHVKIHI